MRSTQWGLPLLLAALIPGAAKRIGFGPLRENEYPAAKWMQAHTTAAAELVPASVQVDFTKGERCVLAHEGVTIREAARMAAADGCMAGDELCGNQSECVGCTRQSFTKSCLGDDAAVLAPSSGDEAALPRHRAGVASMAWSASMTWRSTRRPIQNAP